jgi:hypothetical protein
MDSDMRTGCRVILIALCLAAGSYSMRPGKYWICNNPSNKTATQDRLESRCLPSAQATTEAEDHRKIHPKDVAIFTCSL